MKRIFVFFAMAVVMAALTSGCAAKTVHQRIITVPEGQEAKVAKEVDLSQTIYQTFAAAPKEAATADGKTVAKEAAAPVVADKTVATKKALAPTTTASAFSISDARSDYVPSPQGKGAPSVAYKQMWAPNWGGHVRQRVFYNCTPDILSQHPQSKEMADYWERLKTLPPKDKAQWEHSYYTRWTWDGKQWLKVQSEGEEAFTAPAPVDKTAKVEAAAAPKVVEKSTKVEAIAAPKVETAPKVEAKPAPSPIPKLQADLAATKIELAALNAKLAETEATEQKRQVEVKAELDDLKAKLAAVPPDNSTMLKSLQNKIATIEHAEIQRQMKAEEAVAVEKKRLEGIKAKEKAVAAAKRLKEQYLAKLKKLGYDGEDAVKNFQEAAKIDIGDLGPQTRAWIDKVIRAVEDCRVKQLAGQTCDPAASVAKPATPATN